MNSEPKKEPARVAKAAETEWSAKLASELLAAYLPNANVSPSDLPVLIVAIRQALECSIDTVSPNLGSSSGPRAVHDAKDAWSGAAKVDGGVTRRVPAVAVADSIHDEYLVSLEDGKRYRSLRRHLMAKYGMTPQQYREKWGLPPTYPMVAPSYARDRSEVAKRIGLGRSDDSDEKRRAPTTMERKRHLTKRGQ